MLRRIPAVKWAFTRLRPAPHGGSIQVAPDAADASPGLVAGILEDASALDTSISADTLNCDVAVGASAAEDETAGPVLAESPSEATADTIGSDDSFRKTAAEVEPVVVEEASVATIDVEREPADVLELVINSDPSPEPADDVVEVTPVDVTALVVNDDHSPAVDVETRSILDDTRVAFADCEVSPEHVPEDSINSDLSPVAAEDSIETPGVFTTIEPAPALVSPSPEIRSAPKARARAAEPVDRAALIRQRWTETGIRMWNSRLHGTGDATLNIQGSVGLLPPAPGETMPRYDKLEFRMLGGQIVCEGVIIEPPVLAGHRSFTSLAEPGKPERVREPMRERQAALA
ncbi:hypothetical protein [Bradyrhizobium sp. 21]|uniref:hypothetical protein n=1 Tax=Bradyrhizobium sp. 21 TaxID=2782666 RepID=UPI001FFA0FE1|nr:hypothetical protein [Bradyrhizobium sp. 21]MCK1386704.1 hypothetical protein [Bradyrhizobium sp. 21]